MESTERAILALRNTLKKMDKDRLDAIISKVDQIEIEENSPTIFEYLREMAGQIWTYRILEVKDTSICPNQFYVVFTDGRKEIYTNIDDGDEDEIRTICERLNRMPGFMSDSDAGIIVSQGELERMMIDYLEKQLDDIATGTSISKILLNLGKEAK